MPDSSRALATFGAVLTGLLAAAAPQPGSAAEPSGCVTCHLDQTMIVKNLAASTAKKSALQSGAG